MLESHSQVAWRVRHALTAPPRARPAALTPSVKFGRSPMEIYSSPSLDEKCAQNGRGTRGRTHSRRGVHLRAGPSTAHLFLIAFLPFHCHFPPLFSSSPLG